MPWVVRQGITVSHDHAEYTAGRAVPCTDEQAEAMPHAVEWIEDKAPPAAPEVTTKKRGK